MEQKRKMHLPFIIALLTLASSSVAFAAPPVISATTNGSVGTNLPPITAPNGNVVQSHGGTGPHGVVFSSASAEEGFLKAHAEATTSEEVANSYFSTGTASFQDNFMIDSAGREGQTGYLTIVFVVAGTLAAQANAPETIATGVSYAQVSYDLYAGDLSNPAISKQQQLFSDGSSSSQPFLNQEQTLTIPFTFGTPLDIKIVLSATGRAFTTHAGLYRADTAIRWTGVSKVSDTPNGAIVPFFTFASGSFTNFLQPIPFPSITRISMLPGRHILIDAAGVPLRSNNIIASDQPSAAFNPLGAITPGANGILQFQDTGAASVTRRFYRVSYTSSPP